jgi:hypothetical protein
VLNPSTGGYVLLASDELAACLATAEHLAQSFAMNRVERGHLAAALAHSVTGDPQDARDRLRRYFGDDFDGVEDVFVPDVPGGTAVGPASRFTAAAGTDSGRGGNSVLFRLAYLGGAALLLLSLRGLFLDVPSRVSETRDVQSALQALKEGRNDEAYRLFSEVTQREPRSYIALQGQGCAAARSGDLDRWAAADDRALWVGMPIRLAGACLPADAVSRAGFQVVVTGRVATLVPASAGPSGAIMSGGVLPVVRTDRPLVEVVTDASCAAGRRGLTHYTSEQAAFALNIADQSLVDAATVASELRRCLQEWPPGELRDRVESWVS